MAEQIGSSGESLREAFGKALVELAPKYDFAVFDADIAGGTGVHHFMNAYPDRFIQCGIAEQNMMAMAAGYAHISGKPVFATTFAVFCLRAIEQIRLSIAYSRRNVKIVASHPGLDVGPDGASAQCLEDLAAFRAIPNMLVLSPADALEMRQATEAILRYDGPVYMRTGRSPTVPIYNDMYRFSIGYGSNVASDGVRLPEATDVAIFACGVEVRRAIDAFKILADRGIIAKVYNLSTIKPIDRELIVHCAKEAGAIVTCEDHNVIGGLGSAVAEVLAKEYPCPMAFVGVNDTFGESGEPEELAAAYGIDAQAIADAAEKLVRGKHVNP